MLTGRLNYTGKSRPYRPIGKGKGNGILNTMSALGPEPISVKIRTFDACLPVAPQIAEKSQNDVKKSATIL